MSALLDVADLTTRIPTRNGVVTVVDDVASASRRASASASSARAARARAWCAARSCACRRHPAPLMDGKIVFDGIDLVTTARARAQRPARAADRDDRAGRRSPRSTRCCRSAVRSPRRCSSTGLLPRAAMRAKRTIALMRKVGIPSPETRIDNYPLRVQRRHVPTRGDRRRARLQSAHHPCRRADDGARRDDPGPDSQAPRRAAAGTCGSQCSW